MNSHCNNRVLVEIKCCSQRMRLQRRLYGIYTLCFLIFTIPCNCFLCQVIFCNLITIIKEKIVSQPWDRRILRVFGRLYILILCEIRDHCYPLMMFLILNHIIFLILLILNLVIAIFCKFFFNIGHFVRIFLNFIDTYFLFLV